MTLCLANGAVQCWIVDTRKKTVAVIERDGATAAYGSSTEVPLVAFGSDCLAVDQIFAA